MRYAVTPAGAGLPLEVGTGTCLIFVIVRVAPQVAKLFRVSNGVGTRRLRRKPSGRR